MVNNKIVSMVTVLVLFHNDGTSVCIFRFRGFWGNIAKVVQELDPVDSLRQHFRRLDFTVLSPVWPSEYK